MSVLVHRPEIAPVPTAEIKRNLSSAERFTTCSLFMYPMTRCRASKKPTMENTTPDQHINAMITSPTKCPRFAVHSQVIFQAASHAAPGSTSCKLCTDNTALSPIWLQCDVLNACPFSHTFDGALARPRTVTFANRLVSTKLPLGCAAIEPLVAVNYFHVNIVSQTFI